MVCNWLALQNENYEPLHHGIHLLHDLEPSLTLLSTPISCFTFIYILVYVYTIVCIYLLSMLTVQFVKLFQQIVL